MAYAAGGITHAFGKGKHAIQRAVHLGTEWKVPRRSAQCRVQHRARLADVDRLASEHGIALRLKRTLARKLQQGIENPAIDQVLGKIGKDAFGFEREVRKAVVVLGKRIAQVESRICIAMQR